MSSIKCNIYFWFLYTNIKFLVQHILQLWSNLSFSCHNNSFLINNAPLFTAFNAINAPPLVAINLSLFDVALFNLALLDAALFGAEPF